MSSTANKQVKVSGKRKHLEMVDMAAAVDEDVPHSSQDAIRKKSAHARPQSSSGKVNYI
jgi:hypothetical protein